MSENNASVTSSTGYLSASRLCFAWQSHLSTSTLLLFCVTTFDSAVPHSSPSDCLWPSIKDQCEGMGSIPLYLWFGFYYGIFFFLFRAALEAYESSQARGQIRATGCSCQPTPQPQQCHIWATSETYTTAHGNAGSLPHWENQESNLHPHGY